MWGMAVLLLCCCGRTNAAALLLLLLVAALVRGSQGEAHESFPRPETDDVVVVAVPPPRPETVLEAAELGRADDRGPPERGGGRERERAASQRVTQEQ